MEAILYNRNDSSDNDRGKSYLSGSLRSLESGFHMIATITELFFFQRSKGRPGLAGNMSLGIVVQPS